MTALQCEICGGRLTAKSGGIFECDFCGMQYDKTRVQEMVQEIKGTVKVEGTVEVTGKVQVEGGINIESLLKRGALALEDGEWDAATKFFDEALNLDAECAEAYLGKAMAELEIRKKSNLGEGLFVFSDNRNYEKALRFADVDLKNELDKYSVARIEWREQERIKAITALQTYSEYFKRREELQELHGDLSLDACSITFDQFVEGSYFLLQGGMWDQVPQSAVELGLVHRMDLPEKKPTLTQEEISRVQALVPGVRIACFGSSVLLVADAADDSRYCAKSMVNTIANGVEENKSYCGKVSRLAMFGAFVELAPGREGMIHISKLADYRPEKVEDVVSSGDIVWVKVTEIDEQGRINLSMKDAICEISPRDRQRKEAMHRAEEKRREEEARIEAERRAEQARIKAERKAEWARIEAERSAERARIEAERKAKRRAEQARLEAERRAKKKSELEQEQATLKNELANLKGLFSGKRRKEIEARLVQIENELKAL